MVLAFLPVKPAPAPPTRSAAASGRSPRSLPVTPPPAAIVPAPPWLTTATWLALAVTAVALLWVGLRLHVIGDYFTESDFYGGYAEGARLLQRGGLDPTRYSVVGPVYESVLALAGLVTRDLFLAARLLSIAAALALLVAWWRLVERRVGAVEAAWTTVFLAANPVFFRHAYSATTDMVALALQAACALALLTGRSSRAAFVAGLLAALAFLTRYNALMLLPAGLIALAFGLTRFERRARAAAVLLTGFLAPVVPWVAYGLAHGAGLSFQLHHNIAYEVYARPHGIPWDDYARTMQPTFRGLGDVLARDPAAVLARLLANAVQHARLDAALLFGWPVAALCAAGLALALWDGAWRRHLALWVPGALLYLALVPVFHSERYSLSFAPIVLALAGAALASPRLARFARPHGVPLIAAAGLAVLGLSVADSVAQQRTHLRQLPLEVLEAGRALRRVAPPDARVLCRKAHIGYYAGLDVAPFPILERLADLAAYCRERGVGFLYFSWYEARLRPEFEYLLDPGCEVPGLTVVHAGGRMPAVVYRIGPEFGREPAWFAEEQPRLVHLARAAVQVATGPKLWHAHVVLAMDALDHGRPAEALAHARAATALAPDVVLGWGLLGESLRRTGRPDESIDAFTRALADDGADVPTRVGLASSLVELDRLAEAARALRPVLASVRVHSLLERLLPEYEREGDADAVTAARQALASPDAGDDPGR